MQCLSNHAALIYCTCRAGLGEDEIAAAIEERAAARAAKDYAAADVVSCGTGCTSLCLGRRRCSVSSTDALPMSPQPLFVALDLPSLQVRLRLEAAGILIMDTPQGTTWKPGPRLNIAEEENAAA